MRHKGQFYLLVSVFLFAFLFIPNNAYAACGDGITGGAGTVGDPYQINTPAELAAIGSCTGSGNASKYFQMMNDIDLDVDPYNTGNGWTPIGTSGTAFFGKFNGNGYAISNLFISRSSSTYQGLFAHLGSGGIIENVGLLDVSIVVDDVSGALVGNIASGGIVRYSYGTGTATVGTWAGGLIGSNYGIIRESYSEINTTGNSGAQVVGVLAGENFSSGKTYDSYARGNLIVNSSNAGGLLGNNYSASAGTLVDNSYSTGAVSGYTHSSVRGFVGGNIGTITSSFWDTETSGQSAANTGATGLVTSLMKTQSTFTDAGWDFDTVWAIDPEINDGYPYLQWQDDIQTDTTPPSVSYFVPADGSVDVDVDEVLEIAFNDDIATSTGDIVIYKSADDSIFETIDITSSLVTASGTTAILINPSSNFNNATDYYVQIDATAIDDTTGNSYAGISNETTWNFTTVAAVSSGGGNSTYLTGVCDVSDTEIEVGDEVDFTIEIESSESDYDFEWVNVLSGDDLEESYSFDEAGKYYVRGHAEDEVGNSIIIRCETIEVLESDDEEKRDNSTDTEDESEENSDNIEETESEDNNVDEVFSENNSKVIFTKDLFRGIYDDEVILLQKFLNQNGFIISESGDGSVGNETNFFGPKTKDAVSRFQTTHSIFPNVGYFGILTRTKSHSLNFIVDNL